MTMSKEILSNGGRIKQNDFFEYNKNRVTII